VNKKYKVNVINNNFLVDKMKKSKPLKDCTDAEKKGRKKKI
jgi:hypothetical protein